MPAAAAKAVDVVKDNKLSNWHKLILAVVFFVLWVKFAYGPVMGTFEHLARPRFVATPRAVARTGQHAEHRVQEGRRRQRRGRPIYFKRMPNSPIIVMGPRGADGKIVPMHYQILGMREQPETYYDDNGVVRWRYPNAEGGAAMISLLLSRECMDALHAVVMQNCPCALENREFLPTLVRPPWRKRRSVSSRLSEPRLARSVGSGSGRPGSPATTNT